MDSLQQYDSTAVIDPTSPTSINKGDGKIITVSAYITEPAGTVTLSVFQTLGYEVTVVNAREQCLESRSVRHCFDISTGKTMIF